METARINVLLIAQGDSDLPRVRRALTDPNALRGWTPRFELQIAQEGTYEGLERIARGEVDVVLMDLGTEHGTAPMSRLRKQTGEVPIVVLTDADRGGDALGIQAVQDGAQDYLTTEQLEGSLLTRALRYAVERHRLQETLRQFSLTDELTSLYNRRGFLALAEHHLKVARRTRGLLLALADIDGLWAVNEAFGRDTGDRVVLRAAKTLRDTFRASDVIARVGGDEFAILVLDAADETADLVTRRLAGRLARLAEQRGDPEAALSLSLGTYRLGPDTPPPLDDVLDHALATLSRNKRRAST